MAEANATPTPDTAPAAPAAAAPQAPLPDSPPAAAPAAAPSSEAPAAPAAEAGAAGASPQLTLLQEFDAGQKPEGEKPTADAKPAEPAADAKPAEAAADGKPAEKPAEAEAEAKPEAKPGEKPAEAKPAEAAKPDPVNYEYALPETLKLDDARKGEFHAALDAFRADPSKGAQPLIALHEKAMGEYAQHLVDEQQRVWNDTRKNWRTEVMADEELGGSGYQTAMGKVAVVRDALVPASERKEFDAFLAATGAGDHPAFLRLLHAAHKFVGEGKMPPTNSKPPADLGRQGRRGLLYDHPRSPNNRTQQ